MSSGYVPPALRTKVNYKPRDLKLKPKPVDYTSLKTLQQLYEEYQKKNEGCADSAWLE